MDLMLKAVLSKLTGARTLSVIQSLLMVYAQLFHSQVSTAVIIAILTSDWLTQ